MFANPNTANNVKLKLLQTFFFTLKLNEFTHNCVGTLKMPR